MNNGQTDRGEKRDEFFVVTEFFARRLAYPAALFFKRIGMTANGVTVLGGLLWIASVPVVVIAGRVWMQGRTGVGSALLVSAVVLWNAGYILDVVDGSLARITGSFSSGGSFLDFSFHLIFHPMFLCSIGAFLFLVTDNLAYLVLAILATFSGWGVSFAAKEHVLCEHIAQGKVVPSHLSPDDRYRIYIDSVKMRQPTSAKRGSRCFRALMNEIFCFPGQYSTVSLMALVDILLQLFGRTPPFMLLRVTFVVLTVLPLARVPFRLRREFRTLARYDDLRDKTLDSETSEFSDRLNVSP